MVRSIALAFDDPYSYESAVRAANVSGFISEKGNFRASLTKVDLNDLWLQAGWEQLGRSNHVSVPKSRSPIFFISTPKQGRFELSGRDIDSGQLVFWGEDVSHYLRSTAESGWGAMSLGPEQLANASYALGGREVLASKDTRVLTPDPRLMAHLLTLHRSVTRMASAASEILSHPEVARAIEQTMIDTMVKCLVSAEDTNTTVGWRHHLRIMARFEEWLSRYPDRPAYVAEVCAALGVSQRTLTICCQEHLALSPTRYLWLRRMHLARRELLRAMPETRTVADTAMNYGFWELGRFSVSYKAIFGESPRATLRRPPQELPPLPSAIFRPDAEIA